MKNGGNKKSHRINLAVVLEEAAEFNHNTAEAGDHPRNLGLASKYPAASSATVEDPELLMVNG